MFTGIVQTCTTIKHVDIKPGLIRFSIELSGELAEGLTIGASIAINGICLTVTSFDCHENGSALIYFDMMQQTLDLTNATTFSIDSSVNVERSAKAMQEIGGHIVSGHVDTLATIAAITTTENNCRIRFSFSSDYAKYALNKGFIGLNGCSLTIAAVNADENWLEV
ncbi:MAG: riboflavin synthase subunit alpha, partial [Sinobacterium sp.]|nr:riboflavin synthase subunit alpha [Sinobacterium sp.]